MNKIHELTGRIVALLLSSFLVVGSIPQIAYASENQVETDIPSETVVEKAEESYSEELREETGTKEISEDISNQEEEAVTSYMVTLNANGGFFKYEWDDALGDSVEQAEVVTKYVPAGATISSFPEFADQSGQTMAFAGWSLERNGELITAGDEEYAPLNSCVLYAVWWPNEASESELPSRVAFSGESAGAPDQEACNIEENSDTMDGSQELADIELIGESMENGDIEDAVIEEANVKMFEESDDSQEPEFVEAVDGLEEVYTEEVPSDANTVSNPDNENDTDSQNAVPEKEEVYADGSAEKTDDNTSDTAVIEEETQLDTLESSVEEETVREDAAKGVVKSGTCGDNITWTLDEKGTLTISGTGDMYDYANSSKTPWKQSSGSIYNIVIESGVTYIGECSFAHLPNLTTITLCKGIAYIGQNAFESCTDLKEIKLPQSLKRINSQAFLGCSSLTSVTIPNSVTSIGQEAFGKCNGLTSITIPNSVKDISGAFSGCSSLTSVTIPNSVTDISGAFSGCSNLTSVTIPNSVKDISGAFSGCSSLTSITIPNSVTDISGAFKGCRSLTSVTIPNGVTDISGAFRGCSNLTSVTIPNSVINIGGAFRECTKLTSITIPNSVTRVDSNTFNGCSSLTNVKIPNSVTKIGNSMFEGCSSLTSITLPNSITRIEYRAFYGCSSLRNVKIPDSVTSISDEAFLYYNKYTEQYEPLPELTISGYPETEAQNYAKRNNIPFKSLAESISGASISIPAQTYTGKELKPVVTVKVGSDKLKLDTDYTVAYSNNVNAGTATVTITGKIKYKGTKKQTFKINKAAQSITAKAKAPSIAVGKTTTVSITGAKGRKSYKSSNTKIAAVDKDTGKVTAKKVGTVKITATSAETSNYKAASKTVTIKVIPGATASLTAANQDKGIKLAWKKVDGATGYIVYINGKAVKTINSGSTVTYTRTQANTNGNKYVFKVVAKATTGKSTLSKSLTYYKIARPAISSAISSSSKKMTIKWERNAKATGYQIQYSTSKPFASGNKTVKITKNSTVSKAIGNLTKGKTYYVRIRSYKTVGDKTYNSAWSAAKSVKIAK